MRKGHIINYPVTSYHKLPSDELVCNGLGKNIWSAYFCCCTDSFFVHLDMEQGEYLFSGNSWFKERLDGPDGHLWRKARKMFLFNHNLSSSLNLFKFDYRSIKTITRPEGAIILRGSKKTALDPNEEREFRPGELWADDAKNSIRTLLDRIVTRWVPKYVSLARINVHRLHATLTPTPLQYVKSTYGKALPSSLSQ